MTLITFDFTALHPSESVWWDVPILGGARLRVKHAGQSNAPYTNAVGRRNAKIAGSAQQLVKDGKASELLDGNLDNDRDLFPKHVVVGWEGVCDAEDNPVTFSQEACAEFLKALPTWIMVKLSGFVSVPTNFLPEELPSDADIAATAKN